MYVGSPDVSHLNAHNFEIDDAKLTKKVDHSRSPLAHGRKMQVL